MSYSLEVEQLIKTAIDQSPEDERVLFPLGVEGVMPGNFYLAKGEAPPQLTVPVIVDHEHSAVVPIHDPKKMSVHKLWGEGRFPEPQEFGLDRISRIKGRGILVWDEERSRGGFQLTLVGSVRLSEPPLPGIGIEFILAQYTYDAKKGETDYIETQELGVSVTDMYGFAVRPSLPSNWLELLRGMRYANSTLREAYPVILARLSRLSAETNEQLKELGQPEVQTSLITYSISGHRK